MGGPDGWTQAKNLANENPKKLEELKLLFLIEAARYHVLRLDDRRIERFNPALAGRPPLIHGRTQVLFSGMGRLSENSVVALKNKSHSVTAEVVVPPSGAQGVLHLVHKSAQGTNAVIGVFLKRGQTSGALAPIFASLPDDVNVHHPLEAPFNPAAFLPSDRAHYRYIGSLTTPPCTEGVQWVVMSQPVTVSDEDMAQFAEHSFQRAAGPAETVKSNAWKGAPECRVARAPSQVSLKGLRGFP